MAPLKEQDMLLTDELPFQSQLENYYLKKKSMNISRTTILDQMLIITREIY